MGCGESKEHIYNTTSSNKQNDHCPNEIQKSSSLATSSNDRNTSFSTSMKQQSLHHNQSPILSPSSPSTSPSTINNENNNNNTNNSHQNNGHSFSRKQLHLDTSQEQQNTNSTSNLEFNKKSSSLSLSNESSLNDISVNIPDPFRSNYKITDSLYHKNFRKLYRGIDKDRHEVLVEFTEIRPYESAGYTQVDFFNRIDILRQLDHISIPKVVDVFDGSDVNRVVFDYFPGKDLDCLLKMKGSLPPHAIKPFMLALVSVVQYLHNHQILHRNLSPSSIILAAFSSFVSLQQMRVTGFTRPAKMLDTLHSHISCDIQHQHSQQSNNSTPSSSLDHQPSHHTEDILGGISIVKEHDMDVFSAPELATTNQGPAVDLYSLGGILYNITTGYAPPLGKLDETVSFSEAIWNKEEIVNWKIQSLITRLLSTNPSERPSLNDIIQSFH